MIGEFIDKLRGMVNYWNELVGLVAGCFGAAYEYMNICTRTGFLGDGGGNMQLSRCTSVIADVDADGIVYTDRPRIDDES